MSKIVKNTTASPYLISDVGVTIAASSQYTIPPQDYSLWAASSDVIVGIGSADLVINDGSADLSINNGSKLIQGIFPNPVGIEGSDSTQIGNIRDSLKVIAQLIDEDGTKIKATTFSELRTVERTIDVEAKFYYNINTITLAQTIVGTGTAAVVNRQAVLSTGTDTNGKAQITTRDTILYETSQTLESSHTFVFPSVVGTVGTQTGPADCRMVLGIFDAAENDGIRWGFDDGSRFFIEWIRSGTATRKLATQFNRDALDGVTVVNGQASQYAPDWTKVQLIKVVYSWHGISPFLFQIQTPDGNFRTFHIETFVNQTEVSSIGTPVLPMSALVENTGKTTNTQLMWQAGQISHLGNKNALSNVRYFTTGISPATVSAEEAIFSIRSKTTFASLSNFITLSLEWISLSSSGSKPVKFKIYKDATLTGASFSDVDSTNSVVESDTSATAFSGGIEQCSFALGSDDSANIALKDLALILRSGETYTITAFSDGTNSDVTADIRWRENH